MTRIQRECGFHAGVFTDTLKMYFFSLSLVIEVQTDDNKDQLTAMNRITVFLEEMLDSCVFIHQNNQHMINSLNSVGVKTCVLPEEPYDHIIACMLMSKLNAIVENRFAITDLSLSSGQDGTFIMLTDEDPLGCIASPGWWSTTQPTTHKTKKEKIIQLFTEPHTWNELGLSWVTK